MRISKIIKFIVSITSIAANIIFIFIIVNSYINNYEIIENEEEKYIENISHENNKNDFHEFYKLMKKTNEHWSIWSAAYPDEFPDRWYVSMSIDGNKYRLERIKYTDICKEVRKIMSALDK